MRPAMKSPTRADISLDPGTVSVPQRRDESAAIRASGGLVDDQPELRGASFAPHLFALVLYCASWIGRLWGY